jgi:hypothetical protein
MAKKRSASSLQGHRQAGSILQVSQRLANHHASSNRTHCLIAPINMHLQGEQGQQEQAMAHHPWADTCGNAKFAQLTARLEVDTCQ